MAQLRVAVASLDDPTDESTWSGTPRHMIDGFSSHGVDVVPIGVSSPLARPLEMAGRLRSRIGRRTHVYARVPMLLRQLSAQFADSLRRAGPIDLVLTLGSFPAEVPPGSPPVLTWTDATLDGLMGYYEEWSNWAPRTLRRFRESEQRALAGSDLVVAASTWAAGTAGAVPGVSSDRIVVVPFGANLPEVAPGPPPTPGSPLRMLSVGARWHHKGMDIAVDSVRRLNDAGVAAHLDIAGCQPPAGTVLPGFVTCHGHLSKATPAGRQRLEQLYRDAAVFLLASRSECFGVVFCEAAAYGLPVVAPRTGGIPTAVLDGTTGLLVEGTAPALAAAVRRLAEDPELYRRLSAAGRLRYEQELTWECATARVLQHARERGLLDTRARS